MESSTCRQWCKALSKGLSPLKSSLREQWIIIFFGMNSCTSIFANLWGGTQIRDETHLGAYPKKIQWVRPMLGTVRDGEHRLKEACKGEECLDRSLQIHVGTTLRHHDGSSLIIHNEKHSEKKKVLCDESTTIHSLHETTWTLENQTSTGWRKVKQGCYCILARQEIIGSGRTT